MAVIALWVAGGFLDDSLLRDLGDDLDDRSPSDLPVGEVVRDLVDVAATIGATSVLAAVWPATAYGGALAKAFSMIAPESERSLRGWKGRLLALAVVALLAFGLVVAVIFTLFQVRDTSAGDIALGAALATVLQGLLTGGYLLYVRAFADFEEKYGSNALSLAVLLGFWLLLSNAGLLGSYRLMLKRCRRREERQGGDRPGAAAS